MKEYKIYAQGLSEFQQKLNDFFNANPSIEVKAINPEKKANGVFEDALLEDNIVVRIIYD
jgi:hypothetical protein